MQHSALQPDIPARVCTSLASAALSSCLTRSRCGTLGCVGCSCTSQSRQCIKPVSLGCKCNPENGRAIYKTYTFSNQVKGPHSISSIHIIRISPKKKEKQTKNIRFLRFLAGQDQTRFLWDVLVAHKKMKSLWALNRFWQRHKGKKHG